jgi:hypothetical protein
MSSMRASQRVGVLLIPIAAFMLVACVTQSQMQVAAPAPQMAAVLSVRLEPCIDRTGTKGRDLAAEATALISERLRSTGNFALRDDAPLVLNCEVTQFVEGSAFKRWLMPGWGSTVGQIALMLSSAKDQSAVAIIQGNATVSGGGLYTVGAQDYILKSAADDVIAKLRAWAASTPAAVGNG